MLYLVRSDSSQGLSVARLSCLDGIHGGNCQKGGTPERLAIGSCLSCLDGIHGGNCQKGGGT
jgi:hypothetical protein